MGKRGVVANGPEGPFLPWSGVATGREREDPLAKQVENDANLKIVVKMEAECV
jgi:hypothetical protein